MQNDKAVYCYAVNALQHLQAQHILKNPEGVAGVGERGQGESFASRQRQPKRGSLSVLAD